MMGEIDHRIASVFFVGLCIAFFLSSVLTANGQLYPYTSSNYPYGTSSNYPYAAYYADAAWNYETYSFLNAPSDYQPGYYGIYPAYNNTQASLYYADAAKYYNGIYPGNWSYGPYPSNWSYGAYPSSLYNNANLRKPFNATSDLSKFGKQQVYTQIPSGSMSKENAEAIAADWILRNF